MKHKTVTFERLININLTLSMIASAAITALILFGMYNFGDRFNPILSLVISAVLSAIPIYTMMIIMNKIIVSRYNDMLIAESNEFAETLFNKKITSPEDVKDLVEQLNVHTKENK